MKGMIPNNVALQAWMQTRKRRRIWVMDESACGQNERAVEDSVPCSWDGLNAGQ